MDIHLGKVSVSKILESKVENILSHNFIGINKLVTFLDITFV